MTRTSLRIGLLLVTVGLGGAGALLGAEPDRQSTRQALDEVLQELNALNRWLDDAGRRLTTWQRDVASKDKEIAAIGRSIRDLAAELTATRNQLIRLADERADLDALRVSQAHRIAGHLRDAYRLTGQDFFKLLLNQESPDTFDRMIRYHAYFSEARVKALQAYRVTLASIDVNRVETRTRKATLTEQQAELDERRKSLVSQRRERQTLIAKLNSQVTDKQAVRAQLEADRTRLRTLLAEIKRRATLLDSTQFADSKGKLGWPVRGKLVNRFGQPRAGGRMRWEGLYFQVRTGVEITAIHSGRVVFADWLRGFGLLTIIDHGDEHMSLYGYADVLFKESGDWVEGGEAIASAGRSGGQSASGLYFEVRSNGRPTDPIVWLDPRQ